MLIVKFDEILNVQWQVKHFILNFSGYDSSRSLASEREREKI